MGYKPCYLYRDGISDHQIGVVGIMISFVYPVLMVPLPRSSLPTKILTDEDLDELKGCLDLGFGFSYDEIPELCNTLPALEPCYSMSQKFMDEHQKLPDNAEAASMDSCPSVSSSIANWKISSVGKLWLSQRFVLLSVFCQ
ncbi:hypothetical protein F2P56_027807 [Juglans regia]|uniref:Uncharacterized protein n=1 Tax=Juglans regia TaxID=51240 RepID=A0A833UJ40_JUGRE|nr:hypothetical protein F2P56_027807 [Juglans regia]